MIGDIIISNLCSATGTEHVTEQFWTDRLILQIDELAQKLNYRHLIISTPELNKKYEHLIPKLKMSMIVNTEVEDVCNYISYCKIFIGIDSAWRLISHMFEKPTITISKNCQGFGNVPPSHFLRWLPFPETTFGLHHPTNDIVKLAEKMLENQLYQILPNLALTDQSIDNILIRRNYKVNEEKSILND